MYKITLLNVLSLLLFSHAEETVTEQYNMGRIVEASGFEFENQFEFTEEPEDIQGLFAGFISKEDRYRIKANFVSLADDFYIIPSLSGTFKPTSGHRINASISNRFLNLSAEDFDPYLNINTGWNYLGKNGEIVVQNEEHQLAYLKSPLLNRGQYGHSLFLNHHILFGDDYFLNVHYSPRFGINDYLNIRANFNSFLFNDNVSYYSISPQVSFQKKNVHASANYHYLYQDFSYTLTSHSASLYGGYIHNGSSVEEFTIESNWDSFFTPLLQRSQGYSNVAFSYNSFKSDIIGDNTSTYDRFMTSLSHYHGITDHFVTGGSWAASFSEDDFAHSLKGDFIFHRVKNDGKRVMERSREEFIIGRILSPKEFVISLSGIIPLPGDHLHQSAFSKDPFGSDYPKPSSGEMDFKSHMLNTHIGITDWCMIQGGYSGYFSYDFDNYEGGLNAGAMFYKRDRFYTKLDWSLLPTETDDISMNISADLSLIF